MTPKCGWRRQRLNKTSTGKVAKHTTRYTSKITSPAAAADSRCRFRKVPVVHAIVAE